MYIPPDKDKLPKATEKAWIDFTLCKVKMQMVIQISSETFDLVLKGSTGMRKKIKIWNVSFAIVFTAY